MQNTWCDSFGPDAPKTINTYVGLIMKRSRDYFRKCRDSNGSGVINEFPSCSGVANARDSSACKLRPDDYASVRNVIASVA